MVLHKSWTQEEIKKRAKGLVDQMDASIKSDGREKLREYQDDAFEDLRGYNGARVVSVCEEAFLYQTYEESHPYPPRRLPEAIKKKITIEAISYFKKKWEKKGFIVKRHITMRLRDYYHVAEAWTNEPNKETLDAWVKQYY